jgi:hypothetical protein
MRKTNTFIIIALLLFCGSMVCFQAAKAWGFWAHARINRLAVFTLPPEMIGFYKEHIEFLTEHAVDPDKRRYASDDEAPRHYIDVDHYGKYPFEMMPRKWNDAVAKYTEDTLQAYGIAPWNMEVVLRRLTKAFEDCDKRRILRYSADMGHYVGDGHVPLHTTKNYNGQLTNQKGIHGFWESRLPELYGENYDYWVGKAKYIANPNEYIWNFILESHIALDTVLLGEARLTKKFPSDQKYAYETRGQTTTKTYSEEFSKAYDNILGDMVERRMKKAIISVGSFWTTAWINAGQPDLSCLNEEVDLAEIDREEKERLEKAKAGGKQKGRKHDNEGSNLSID